MGKKSKGEGRDAGEASNLAARVTELEEALKSEKQERAEADQRASRANERAQEADAAFRKLQLDLVKANDEVVAERDRATALEEKSQVLETGILNLKEELATAKSASSAQPSPRADASAAPASPGSPAGLPAGLGLGSSSVAPLSGGREVEQMLARIGGLREMLATVAIELSQLHADEIALGKRRSRVLSDACALLARAVGTSGQAPPPLPSPALEARLTVAPVVDISEVADLIESLRPPRAAKVE